MLAAHLSGFKVFFEVVRYASDLVAIPMNRGGSYSSCRTATPINDRSSYFAISCLAHQLSGEDWQYNWRDQWRCV